MLYSKIYIFALMSDNISTEFIAKSFTILGSSVTKKFLWIYKRLLD